jgi:hypothetical protein
MDSLKDVKARSAALVPLILNNYKTDKPVTVTVRDTIANLPSMTGVAGQDPTMMNVIMPNVYKPP